MILFSDVGKSSLINSLKRSRACGVGAVPGFTRAMQEVQLDSKVKLLDSPGMVLASGNMTDSSVALRNAVRVDCLDDPVTPVQAILQRWRIVFAGFGGMFSSIQICFVILDVPNSS